MAKHVARSAPAHPDPLGLRRVLGDRLLPILVGAMAFLAAMALGGAIAAQDWADRWRLGAGTAFTALVPQPNETADPGVSRLARGLDVLRASPAIADATPLAPAELDALLGPWLGVGASATPPISHEMLPAVIAVHALANPPGGAAALDRLADTLRQAVPGASLESHDAWVGRLSRLLRALEACGWGALLLVVGVAALVVAAAARAGLVARRTTIDILHGLGATDQYVASRFARRAMGLAAIGGCAGTLLAVPVLLGLGQLAAGFAEEISAGLPAALWSGLALLPIGAAAIGYATAHVTVRLWLRRLP